MTSEAKCRRRALAEAAAILARKPAHMIEAALPRYLDDDFLRLSTTERLPDPFVARGAQIAHRRGAFEIAKMLNKGAWSLSLHARLSAL